jgi:hypothetical protein
MTSMGVDVASDDQSLSKMSEADMCAQVLAGWERLSRAVPDGPRKNRRLAAHYNIDLSDVEHVRDTRNHVAHPTSEIPRTNLKRALKIIRRVEARTTAVRTHHGAEQQYVRKPRTTATGYTPPTLSTSSVTDGPAPSPQPRRKSETPAPVTPAKRALDLVADHWKVLLVVCTSAILAIVIVANYGVVGLIALPFIVVLALVLLWVLLYISAFACLVYSIVLFVQHDNLKAFLFLWLFLILGTIAELIRLAVFE